MTEKKYIKFLQYVEALIIEKCNRTRAIHNLKPLMFQEDCSVEPCRIDCPIMVGEKHG